MFGFVGAAARNALAEPQTRIADPLSFENLSVYFIHGKSAGGPVPLTLQEALAKGSVRLLETGTVNELKIDNTGSEEIFIQAGDIVKGGKQDRVLAMSFVLPPKSGEVPIAAFCVERGRWSARGAESVGAFASAMEAMPSQKAKLAMAAAPAAPRAAARDEAGITRARSEDIEREAARINRQAEVWASVAETQQNLTGSLKERVTAAASETSLQLSLENEKLKEAQAGYVKALQSPGEKDGDIIGYVFAVNGRIASADVYPSNALFRKMWPKQLAAGATAAIGEKSGAGKAPAPDKEAARKFLAEAEAGKGEREVVGAFSKRDVREAPEAVYVEAQRSNGSWIHRSYLAK
jgi:hypothetical protein